MGLSRGLHIWKMRIGIGSMICVKAFLGYSHRGGTLGGPNCKFDFEDSVISSLFLDITFKIKISLESFTP